MTRNLAIFLTAVDNVEDLTPATRDDGYVAEVGDHPLAIAARMWRRGRRFEKGSKVVVHYTAEGPKETADAADKIGDERLKAVRVTITHVDHATKTVAAGPTDGTKKTYHLT